MPQPERVDNLPASDSASRRFDALDALRGLAILTMALSGLVPFGVLPTWMYHAQLPPPGHAFDPALPGLTWVDLVFPFFLFSMGASMPLALSRRIARGARRWELALYVGQRGLLLGMFAIYDQHIRAMGMAGHPGRITWLLSLAGFALLFPILARLPKSWSRRARYAIRAIGWIGAVALLSILRYAERPNLPESFSVYRSDIIIVVLTNMAVLSSAIWLVSRNNWLLRLGFLGLFLALRLGHEAEGWVNTVWNWSPAPWIYRLDYQKYLFIVIPGTIVGDLILRWMNAPPEEPDREPGWSAVRTGLVALFGPVMVLLLLVGLQARWLTGTTFIALGLCAIVWPLLSRPGNAYERLLHRLYGWAAFWLALGLLFEPYEGGIKKDPSTLSYYFVTTALAILVLISLSVLIDVLARRRWLRLLIDAGQNPMIAYSGVNSLFKPVLYLIGAEAAVQGWITVLPSPPWCGVAWACLKTLLLALAVSVFTRRRIYWRT